MKEAYERAMEQNESSLGFMTAGNLEEEMAKEVVGEALEQSASASGFGVVESSDEKRMREIVEKTMKQNAYSHSFWITSNQEEKGTKDVHEVTLEQSTGSLEVEPMETSEEDSPEQPPEQSASSQDIKILRNPGEGKVKEGERVEEQKSGSRGVQIVRNQEREDMKGVDEENPEAKSRARFERPARVVGRLQDQKARKRDDKPARGQKERTVKEAGGKAFGQKSKGHDAKPTRVPKEKSMKEAGRSKQEQKPRAHDFGPAPSQREMKIIERPSEQKVNADEPKAVSSQREKILKEVGERDLAQFAKAHRIKFSPEQKEVALNCFVMGCVDEKARIAVAKWHVFSDKQKRYEFLGWLSQRARKMRGKPSTAAAAAPRQNRTEQARSVGGKAAEVKSQAPSAAAKEDTELPPPRFSMRSPDFVPSQSLSPKAPSETAPAQAPASPGQRKFGLVGPNPFGNHPAPSPAKALGSAQPLAAASAEAPAVTA